MYLLPSSSPPPRVQDVKGKAPIIVVPASITAKLNMFNAPRFLDKGEFVRPEQAKEGAGEKPPVMSIRRKYVPPSCFPLLVRSFAFATTLDSIVSSTSIPCC